MELRGLIMKCWWVKVIAPKFHSTDGGQCSLTIKIARISLSQGAMIYILQRCVPR